ncbi:MAG: (Fe-S)-binding protein [Desulfobacterales bacterium]|nr:(Fe-S)-binding protein [Desulfobacterales bacterium]
MTNIKKLAQLVKELEDQFVVCIRCGMCQSVCPLFEQTKKEADVARGKLALLDGLMNRMFSNPEGASERLNRCLLCGSCASNCPSGVNVLEIFIKARIILTEYKGLSRTKKIIFRNILSKPKTFNRLMKWAGHFQGIFTKKNKNSQGTSCARLISPLLSNRNFMPVATEPFHEHLPKLDTVSSRSRLKVAFFTGCLIDKIFPKIAKDCIDVFHYHDIGVFIPENQGCCGIPALASGDLKTFEQLVEHHVDLFENNSFDYLITACATCTSTIKKLWPAIYKGNQNRVQNFVEHLSEKTLDINQFLVANIKIDSSHTDGDTDKEIVTYHDPCHLKKSLGIFKEPRQILNASGIKLIEMESPDKCCGMGGSFNLFHYDISSKIGTLKYESIVKTSCKTVATGCPACMMQISDMLAKNKSNINVKHPIELYANNLKSKEGLDKD